MSLPDPDDTTGTSVSDSENHTPPSHSFIVEGPIPEDQLPPPKRYRRSEVTRIVVGTPLQVMRAISQLSLRTFEREGLASFFLVDNPYRPWGIGEAEGSTSARRFDTLISSEAVENIEVAVFPGSSSTADLNLNTLLGWLHVESHGTNATKVVLRFDTFEGMKYKERWNELCDHLDDMGYVEVGNGLPGATAAPAQAAASDPDDIAELPKRLKEELSGEPGPKSADLKLKTRVVLGWQEAKRLGVSQKTYCNFIPSPRYQDKRLAPSTLRAWIEDKGVLRAIEKYKQDLTEQEFRAFCQDSYRKITGGES